MGKTFRRDNEFRTKSSKFKKNKKDGSSFMFNLNAGVLINKQNKPIATRILGPVTKELKTNKLMKVASLSAGFL